MSTRYTARISALKASPRTWLVTGAAGFIGSHLVENLLRLGQRVRGIDNFFSGKKENFPLIQSAVGDSLWKNFEFVEGDILDEKKMATISQGVDFVLHQAAIGSVPRSIKAPTETNRANVDGFLCTALAARDAKVKRIVYASSSSVYGSDASLPKKEDVLGEQLSPYAVSKYADELYARTFSRAYGIEMVGLRYFNVFGARQDPNGMYAAVIPKWVKAQRSNETCTIFGDGETSRDFCYIDNVVQANILAATEPLEVPSAVCNIAVGHRTSLTELYNLIGESLIRQGFIQQKPAPVYSDFRQGDIRHSHADISRAQALFGYEPTIQITQGIDLTTRWYAEHPDL